MNDVYTEAWTAEFRQLLIRWYKQNARNLPWRETTDAYRIWVSEIMLQQTQVATVIDYYHRFLERFPNVASLAAAEEQQVLSLWAGLGYYRRARQMHAAAKVIVDERAGQFPRQFDAVLSLPGIGRYTAGAIVSFAFNQPAPILEANTIRLFSRLMGLREDPKRADSQKRLWNFAESILPMRGSNVARVNQAAMELGSLVCLPKQPRCDACPVAPLCFTRRHGLQAEIPRAAQRAAFTPLQHALVIIRRRGKVLMRQNPTGGWWQGLWDFPRVDLAGPDVDEAFFNAEQLDHPGNLALVAQRMHQTLQLDCQPQRHVRTLKHGVTRYRIALYCFEAECNATAAATLPSQSSWQWVSLSSASQLPMTSTAEKLRTWLATAEPRASRQRAAKTRGAC